MLRNFTRPLAALAGAAALGAMLAAGPALAQIDGLKIIAPAGPGGGWDQTARAMQEAMQSAGVARNVQVTNVPGAGGTIGLAQFATQSKGDAKSLMVGGLVMVGAVLTNKAPVTLDQVTPIARLTGEYELVVVPAQSDIKSLADLVRKFKENPRAVSWAGGSAGGTDHILVGLMAKALSIDPKQVNYVPFSGGGEALAALLGGHVTAGVSGIGEFLGQIQAGKLRAIAVSSPQRLGFVDAPTLKEGGVDVELVNWRGVMAPPNLKPQDRQALIDAVDKMVASPSWQDTLKKRDWMNVYLKGDEFASYLKQERAQVETILKDIGLVQ